MRQISSILHVPLEQDDQIDASAQRAYTDLSVAMMTAKGSRCALQVPKPARRPSLSRPTPFITC